MDAKTDGEAIGPRRRVHPTRGAIVEETGRLPAGTEKPGRGDGGTALERSCVACGTVSEQWLCVLCDREARTDVVTLVRDELPATASAYAPELFEELAELEPRSFWFRSRNQLLAWALRRYFPQARSLLEIGCGTGFVLSELHARYPRLDVAGAELFAEGLCVARRRLPGVPLLQADICTADLQEAFDVVTALDVIEHVDDDRAAIRGIVRAVKPGGGVLVTVPQHQSLWSAADEFAGHRRRYERADLLTKLEAEGLETLRATSFVSFLLPVMLLSRRRGAAGLDDYDFRREFELLAWVDRAFEAIMTFERSLVRAGVSLPLGGSLLVVARRREA